MDHKTLGDIFQEIYDDFSDMKPTSLDQLENKVLAAMDKFGSYLMHSKITDWNSQTRHENCPECGTKLEHKNKERQIATWVCDMDYKGTDLKPDILLLSIMTKPPLKNGY